MADVELPSDSRPVQDFHDPRAIIPGFAVKSDGVVFWWYMRGRRWVPLKPKTGPGGFRKVHMRIKGIVHEVGVALLVLRAFIGPRPIGCEPLHFPDPDPGNNRVENLRWAPRGASKLGRVLGPRLPVPKRGSAHHEAVLTEADIPEIRRMYREGFRYKEIAGDLGVAEETIRHVLIGETWRHVPDPDGPITMRKGPDSDAAGNTKLDWATVRQIRAEHGAGKSYAMLAEEHGVSKCTVRDIIVGRTWKEGR